MITLENYVLEQEINDASFLDAELEQAYAEFEVASAILDCAIKQEMIQEYTSTDVSEFGVFMEGEKWDKFKDSAKAKGTAIKEFFKKLFTMIGTAFDRFIDFFSHTNFKSLKKSVEKNVADDALIPNVDITMIRRIFEVFDLVEQLTDIRDDPNQNMNINVLKAFDNKVNKTLNIVVAGKDKDKKSDKKTEEPDYNPERDTVSKDSLLNYLDACADLQKKLGGFRSLKRKLALKDFDAPKDIEGSDEQKREVKKFSKELKDLYVSIAKKLTRQFANAGKMTQRVINAIVKDTKTASKTSKKDDFFGSKNDKNEILGSEKQDLAKINDDDNVGAFDVDDVEAERARNASQSSWGNDKERQTREESSSFNLKDDNIVWNGPRKK